jgi:hypothetical protein
MPSAAKVCRHPLSESTTEACVASPSPRGASRREVGAGVAGEGKGVTDRRVPSPLSSPRWRGARTNGWFRGTALARFARGELAHERRASGCSPGAGKRDRVGAGVAGEGKGVTDRQVPSPLSSPRWRGARTNGWFRGAAPAHFLRGKAATGGLAAGGGWFTCEGSIDVRSRARGPRALTTRNRP